MAAAGFGLAVAYAALRWRPFRVEVRGDSMLPTLEHGVWALAVVRPVRAGDIVVVEHPERPGFELVKRVVAVPGDAAPDGRMLRADEYWVEGDAGVGSSDSRAFGAVGRAHVKGTVVYVWWPSGRRGRV
ncbi:MAG TPA: S26 family signal peptidase [Actinomycetota bacterium]|nr:S26 family signal peptidase [Actinomycetota bacterium]